MFNYILYRIGQFIALYTPLKLGYAIAVFISDVRYLFARQDRRAVKENLKAIFPQKSEKEILKIRLQMFRNFAKYLVDFFRFSKINKDYIRRNVKLENIHYIDEALAKKNGAIALSAHLGNWELGGIVVAQLGYPLWAVALPHKYKKIDDFFNFQRENKGMKVIPLGKAVRRCLNVFKKNEIVALVGDRDFTQKGIVIDFFGKPTFLPEGPAAFAITTGAVIVPAFMLRNKDDTFTLKMERPIDYCPTADKKKDLLELSMRCKVIIEDCIKKFPDQWYMFRRFWIE